MPAQSFEEYAATHNIAPENMQEAYAAYKQHHDYVDATVRDARAALDGALGAHPQMTENERQAAIRARLGGNRPVETYPGGEPFTVTVILRVHEGFFSVDGRTADGDESVFASTDYTNRLFGLSGTGLFVFTGLNTGPVPIRVEASLEEPPMLHGEWVGEASLRSVHGFIGVTSFDDAARIPSAGIAGPGEYRVRISARGRERHFDEVNDELLEAYVLQVWPAPFTGPVMLVEPPST